MYILSQVLAGFGLFFTTSGRLFKKQSANLIFNIIANLFFVVSNIILAAYMGAASALFSVVRTLVFYLFLKNNKKNQPWVLYVCLILYTLMCILTFTNWIDFVLIMVKGCTYTYGSWQQNVKVFRTFSIISSSFAFVYYMLYRNYVNGIAELLAIVFIIIVIIRTYIENSKAKKEKSETTTTTAN